MRRPILLGIIAMFIAGAMAYTHADDSSPSPPAQSYPEGNIMNWRGLNFPTVRFAGMPLDEAMDKFREVTHANVVIDWPALETAGYHRNTPIHLRLYNVTALKALELILAQVNDPNTTARIDYMADDEGVTHISTADEIHHVGILRMYDIRDLIARFFDPLGKESQEVFKDPKPVAAHSEAIMQLIKETVDTGRWEDVGGQIGSMHVFAGHLFIRQTMENHRRIEVLLANLREATAARARGEVITHGINLLSSPATAPVKR